MNNDEKFHQRWEFRRGEDDRDTSTDDSQSNLSHKKPKLITTLVLHENEEASDSPRERREEDDAKNRVRSKKKVKSSKKKNAVENKPKKTPVKENRRRKKNIDNAKDVVMFEDLNTFSNSLIHDLKVARESMFTKMKDEMGKILAAVRSNSRPVKKKVERPQKRASRGKNVKGKMASDGKTIPKAVETSIKHDQVVDVTKTRISSKTSVVLGNDTHKVVSSSSPYLTLPCVIPKPQLQNRGNTSISASGIGNSMDPKSYYLDNNIPLLQPQGQFGNISNISCRNVDFRFPVLMNRGLDCNGSEISSLTCTDNSIRGGGKFGDGEYASLRLQDLKESQFYLADFRKFSGN